MKKLLSSALLSVVVASGVYGQTIIKFAHDNKEDVFENPAHAFAGTFKSIVETASNGEIKVEMYPSNQLGSSKEHLDMTRKGIIQATLTSVGAMASSYPRIGIIDLPFAFNSYIAAYNVWDGNFGKEIASDIESELKDIKVLGFPDTGGFFGITNSKRPIETLEDFKGIRIRTMTLASHQKILNSLGAQAYPLSWAEVYTGLQTGVIDGQMNPIPTVSFAKFYEVQKYLTVSNHLFTPYTFTMNKKFYDKFTDAQKKIISRATQAAIIAGRGVSLAIANSDSRGLAFLSKKMKISSLSPKELKRMREVSQPAVKKLIAEKYDTKAQDLLKVYITEVDKANNIF
ncbi:MAG: DctP family TRAP transporter solute-binding subunit [Campylobacteraceae bacterium]|nr:DctP family TRAP transporter solute-binding subunit [Campylobacteraceae bacterium]